MTRPLSKEVRYAIVSAVVSCVFMLFVTIMYTNNVDERRARDERDNDRQWCDLIVFYDDQFKVTPPQNDIQRQVATYMHNLRKTLGCPR